MKKTAWPPWLFKTRAWSIAKSEAEHRFQEKFECLKETRDCVEKPVPGSGLRLNIVQKFHQGAEWKNLGRERDECRLFLYISVAIFTC